MYCKICGASLTPGDVFCKNCGASNTNINVEPAVPNVEPTPVQQEGQGISNVQSNVGPVPPVESVEVLPNDAIGPVPPIEPVEVLSNDAIGPVPPTEPPKPEKEDKKEKQDSGKFLVVIGVIVGILSAFVIGYLIYSSLTEKSNKNNSNNVTVINQSTYTILYGNHNFVFNSDISTNVGEYLDIKKINFNARIAYFELEDFSKIKVEDVQKSFEGKTEFVASEVNTKSYNGLSCFETNLDYTDGTKTALLLCNRAAGGYWYAEIGVGSYSAYPTIDVINEVAGIMADAKKVETTDNSFKVGKIEIKVEETENLDNVTE